MSRYFLLLVGILACSTAVIWIKLSSASAVVLCAGRLLMAAAILSPLLLRSWKRRQPHITARIVFRRTFPGAALLAVHFVTWAMGARMTPAANSTLIVNLIPAAMPFMLWLLASERVRRHETAGTLIALLGVAVLSVPKLQFDPEHVAGDAVCFGSMLLMAAYLAIGKLLRRDLDLWLYMVPLYGMAGLICLGFALLDPSQLVLPLHEWGWLAVLALIPTVIGHSALNYSMTQLRGQVVSVFNLFQFIFAAIMAWMVWNEIPAIQFYPAAVLVVIGSLVCLGVVGQKNEKPRELIKTGTPIPTEVA